MKTLAKSVLGLAILAANSTHAAEVMTMDPSLTFTYKNYYFHSDSDNSKKHDWSHAVLADFDSGYVNDLLGVVVTAGYAGGLDHDRLFENVPQKGTSDDGDTISGFQQAYLKTKSMFSGVDFIGTAGVKKRETQTYSDSDSRILAASSTGFDLSFGFEGAELYYTEIYGVSDRTASTLNKSIDKNLKIIGANYGLEGLELAAEYGKVEDGVKQTFLKAAYGLILDDISTVDFDVRYGKVKSDAGSDYRASYYNLNTNYTYDNAYLGLGYNKTKDGNYDPDYGIGANNDLFNSSLDQWEKYAREGEKAYIISGGYNFADQGLAGLDWDLWFAKGDDAKNVDNFKRREYGSMISYDFDAELDGLTIAWLYVNYRADGIKTDSWNDLYDEDVNRLYLSYSFKAF